MRNNGLEIDPVKLERRVQEIERKGWSDAKRFVFEHLIISCGLIICGLGLDFIFNLFHTLFSSGVTHPYKIGALQIFSATLGTILFARNLDRWRYVR